MPFIEDFLYFVLLIISPKQGPTATQVSEWDFKRGARGGLKTNMRKIRIDIGWPWT